LCTHEPTEGGKLMEEWCLELVGALVLQIDGDAVQDF